MTLLYMIIYEKHIMFNIAYGEMHEYLAWQRQASLNSFDNGFHEIIVLLQFLKMLLPWLVKFGKLIENIIDNERF